VADERPQFPGSRAGWTDRLEFVKPDLYDGIPVYRVMDRKGKVIEADQDPQVIIRIYVFHKMSIKNHNRMQRRNYKTSGTQILILAQ
jgi:2-oxoisovalerate dehydrogenase E1 component alpha subunit